MAAALLKDDLEQAAAANAVISSAARRATAAKYYATRDVAAKKVNVEMLKRPIQRRKRRQRLYERVKPKCTEDTCAKLLARHMPCAEPCVLCTKSAGQQERQGLCAGKADQCVCKSQRRSFY